MGDERAVEHVGLLYLVAGFDAHQLGHEPIHHIGIILGFEGTAVGQQSQVDELRACDIVESEQIGARLLYRVAVGLERIGVGAGKKLSAAMAQAFVEVGVQLIGYDLPLPDALQRSLVDGKLLQEAIAPRSLVVGVGDVAYAHTL